MEWTEGACKERGAGWSEPLDGIWDRKPGGAWRKGKEGIVFLFICFFFCVWIFQITTDTYITSIMKYNKP